MAVPTAAAGLTFRRQRAEPACLWIGFRPSRWPGSGPSPGSTWRWVVSAARGATLRSRSRRSDRTLLDDLVYVPPVAPERVSRARSVGGAGWGSMACRSLLQLRPGESPAAKPSGQRFRSAALSPGGRSRSAGLPAVRVRPWSGGWWPGITDDPEFCQRGLERSGAGRNGTGTAAGAASRTTPEARDRRDGRRAASSRGSSTARRLRHGRFARLARRRPVWRHVLIAREAPAGTPRAGNRRVAARLAQIADLWLLLGRPEADAQELFRAARWVEGAEHDLAAAGARGQSGSCLAG